MKLIFAQGNPGREYIRTRHNAGFIVLDILADDTPWKKVDKFKAEIAEISINHEKVLLVKPLSFYNQTGQVARAIVDFYKLSTAEDILVIHDELALPFGTIRVREKGSDAGNNGIKSLNAHLGENYTRVRLGIWNDQRSLINDADFVLSAFTGDEMKTLQQLASTKILELINAFIEGNLEPVSHKLEQ